MKVHFLTFISGSTFFPLAIADTSSSTQLAELLWNPASFGISGLSGSEFQRLQKPESKAGERGDCQIAVRITLDP
jgi:hypothetical protein